MTGRRDLGGGGPLHLWNIQNTPGTPGQDATDSEMQGVRSSVPTCAEPLTRMPANLSSIPPDPIRRLVFIQHAPEPIVYSCGVSGSHVACVQGEDQHATKVWGTDINVADVRKNFTQFIKGFREQEGSDEAGVPKFKEEIKYLEYLQTVRSSLHGCCIVLNLSQSFMHTMCLNLRSTD